MDILIINLLLLLNSVKVNYELYRRNYDFERFSYTVSLNCCCCCYCGNCRLLASRVFYGQTSLKLFQLLWRRRDRCVRHYIVITEAAV